MTDPMTLLRAADPAAELTAAPPAHLRERIAGEPVTPPSPERPRRRRRLAVGLAAAAALAVGLVATSPWTSSSPGVIARAADAYDDPDAVIHFKLRFSSGTRTQPLADMNETWQTVDSRRERMVTPDGAQFVTDTGRGASDFYEPGAAAIERGNPVDVRNEPPGSLGEAGGSGTPHVGDVAALLQQAREGRNGLAVVGEATVRGIPVHELRLTTKNTSGQVRATSLGLMGAGQTLTRTIYLDRSTYLPVRLVEEATVTGGPPMRTIADFIGIEKLRSGPAADALLEVDAPAGTPVRVLPPFDDSRATPAP